MELSRSTVLMMHAADVEAAREQRAAEIARLFP
jgi:hypothetical protein